jgi:hypothetical protein
MKRKIPKRNLNGNWNGASINFIWDWNAHESQKNNVCTPSLFPALFFFLLFVD